MHLFENIVSLRSLKAGSQYLNRLRQAQPDISIVVNIPILIPTVIKYRCNINLYIYFAGDEFIFA